MNSEREKRGIDASQSLSRKRKAKGGEWRAACAWGKKKRGGTTKESYCEAIRFNEGGTEKALSLRKKKEEKEEVLLTQP